MNGKNYELRSKVIENIQVFSIKGKMIYGDISDIKDEVSNMMENYGGVHY